jgi:hypothetical protein
MSLNYPDQIVQCVSDDYTTLKRTQHDKASFFGSLTAMKVQRSKACDCVI